MKTRRKCVYQSVVLYPAKNDLLKHENKVKNQTVKLTDMVRNGATLLELFKVEQKLKRMEIHIAK